MAQIQLNTKQIDNLKQQACLISKQLHNFIDNYSTVSVERSVLRLFGVDGINRDKIPLANRLVDIIQQKSCIKSGISRYFTAAMLQSNKNARITAELIEQGKIKFGNLNGFSHEKIKNKETELTNKAIKILDTSRKNKRKKQKKFPKPSYPLRYMIVATGNIYEDRLQASSAVMAGADIIAVIRSTAQSLLDYIPYGPTTEGFGGTYATQENFKIMRKALDEASENAKRYISLVNYASGLCMPEIAVCAVFEDLDMLLNDSMYGILFRDINMKRTFVDQYFSRLICSRAKIIINTGEDNYLTTSDAIENAYTVTASQLINEALGKKALLTDDLLGLGHAFEINPEIKNAFLFELAHAQLAKQLFPKAVLKYMPPTKYKSTDIFYSHCMDALYNLASVLTGQKIHLAGILSEASHTPLMFERYQSLSNINYVFNIAKDLGNEIEFKNNGIIQKRVKQVLDEAEVFLSDILKTGLMEAIADGKFANIKRPVNGGKGLDGVFLKSPDYSNPILERLEKEGIVDG